MLVPLIGTAALTPHLDLDRQRRNMMKRFDWSIPSASESSVLEDSGRPDWNAYETAVTRLKGREVCFYISLVRKLVLSLSAFRMTNEELGKQRYLSQLESAL